VFSGYADLEIAAVEEFIINGPAKIEKALLGNPNLHRPREIKLPEHCGFEILGKSFGSEVRSFKWERWYYTGSFYRITIGNKRFEDSREDGSWRAKYRVYSCRKNVVQLDRIFKEVRVYGIDSDNPYSFEIKKPEPEHGGLVKIKKIYAEPERCLKNYIDWEHKIKKGSKMINYESVELIGEDSSIEFYVD